MGEGDGKGRIRAGTVVGRGRGDRASVRETAKWSPLRPLRVGRQGEDSGELVEDLLWSSPTREDRDFLA